MEENQHCGPINVRNRNLIIAVSDRFFLSHRRLSSLLSKYRWSIVGPLFSTCTFLRVRLIRLAYWNLFLSHSSTSGLQREAPSIGNLLQQLWFGFDPHLLAYSRCLHLNTFHMTHIAHFGSGGSFVSSGLSIKTTAYIHPDPFTSHHSSVGL